MVEKNIDSNLGILEDPEKDKTDGDLNAKKSEVDKKEQEKLEAKIRQKKRKKDEILLKKNNRGWTALELGP